MMMNQGMQLMAPKTMPRTPHLDLMSPEKQPKKQNMHISSIEVD